MKDETKEILQDVIDDIYQCGEYIGQAKKLEKVLDYITNLEKENKRLQNKNIELVLERDRAREENEVLKERKNKAIEYIKDLCYIESKNEWFTYGDDLSPEHIVNILQGDDKNE